MSTIRIRDARVPLSTEPDSAREISAEITRMIGERQARAAAFGRQFGELWEVTAQCLGGGKLLRPRLLLGAFDALTSGGSQGAGTRPEALKIAAALEILHFAFLLHDDLIDGDLVRRGQLNLVGRLLENLPRSEALNPSLPQPVRAAEHARRLHWARSSGLLAGDLMLTIAHQTIAQVRIDEDARVRLLKLLDDTVTETVAGEYYDVSFAGGCVTPDLGLVLDMTRMKTAAYTFELPLRAAAVVAGAKHRTEQLLGEIGGHLGVAFQLQDDLLSAFGASEVHGKDRFSDFREGKETAFIAYARMTAEWPSIELLLGEEEFSDATGHKIQKLLDACGARSFVEATINEQIRTAVVVLSENRENLNPEISQFILSLVDSLEGRQT